MERRKKRKVIPGLVCVAFVYFNASQRQTEGETESMTAARERWTLIKAESAERGWINSERAGVRVWRNPYWHRETGIKIGRDVKKTSQRWGKKKSAGNRQGGGRLCILRRLDTGERRGESRCGPDGRGRQRQETRWWYPTRRSLKLNPLSPQRHGSSCLVAIKF